MAGGLRQCRSHRGDYVRRKSGKAKQDRVRGMGSRLNSAAVSTRFRLAARRRDFRGRNIHRACNEVQAATLKSGSIIARIGLQEQQERASSLLMEMSAAPQVGGKASFFDEFTEHELIGQGNKAVYRRAGPKQRLESLIRDNQEAQPERSKKNPAEASDINDLAADR